MEKPKAVKPKKRLRLQQLWSVFSVICFEAITQYFRTVLCVLECPSCLQPQCAKTPTSLASPDSRTHSNTHSLKFTGMFLSVYNIAEVYEVLKALK